MFDHAIVLLVQVLFVLVPGVESFEADGTFAFTVMRPGFFTVFAQVCPVGKRFSAARAHQVGLLTQFLLFAFCKDS